MSAQRRGLERVTEAALTAGLLVSSALLLVGLATGGASLRWGMVLLMLTPVARVVVVTAGLYQERDWVFGSVSLWVLVVLLSGIYVASRL